MADYDTHDIPSELVALVGQLMPLMLLGEHASLTALRAQWAEARMTKATISPAGFYVDFTVPAGVPLAEPRNISSGSADISADGLKHGAGCVLHIRDGKLSCLEGFTYDDEWPEHPSNAAVARAVPVAPGT